MHSLRVVSDWSHGAYLYRPYHWSLDCKVTETRAKQPYQTLPGAQKSPRLGRRDAALAGRASRASRAARAANTCGAGQRRNRPPARATIAVLASHVSINCTILYNDARVCVRRHFTSFHRERVHRHLLCWCDDDGAELSQISVSLSEAKWRAQTKTCTRQR